MKNWAFCYFQTRSKSMAVNMIVWNYDISCHAKLLDPPLREPDPKLASLSRRCSSWHLCLLTGCTVIGCSIKPRFTGSERRAAVRSFNPGTWPTVSSEDKKTQALPKKLPWCFTKAAFFGQCFIFYQCDNITLFLLSNTAGENRKAFWKIPLSLYAQHMLTK